MNGLAPGQSAEDAVAAMLAPTAAIVPPTSSVINITLSVDVPDADIIDLLETAACGGINYWADALDIDEEARTVQIWVSDPDPGDNNIPVKRVLKFDWIAKRLVQLGTGQEVDGSFSGYAGVRRQAARYVGDRLDGGLFADLDADVADVVVQIAYFNGIVVFG